MVKHITWDDSFNVGHSMIDSQHKRLFELVQELYELTMLPKEVRDNGASTILQECAGYINYHFTCEEKLMRDTQYEDATSHISQHKAFNAYITATMGDSSRGSEIDVEKFYDFLADWLKNHIVSEDKKLAAAISATPQES